MLEQFVSTTSFGKTAYTIGFALTDTLVERLSFYPEIVCIYDRNLTTFVSQLPFRPTLTIPLEGGEKIKSREMKAQIEDTMVAHAIGSSAAILAIGGGTILDLAAFIACTYCRGIALHLLPTTLLAMCDASIGGKNGVNVGAVKNWIGTLYAPTAVYIDPTFLYSLPLVEMQNGVVEMCKHSWIGGAGCYKAEDLSPLLAKEPHVLFSSVVANVRFKVAVVEQEGKTPGVRHLLNFGHTIGHALESLSDWSVPHGQAVAQGMVVEAAIARALGLFSDSSFEELAAMVGASISTPKRVAPWRQWQSLLLKDKKRVGDDIPLVLLQEKGKVYLGPQADRYCHGVAQEKVREVLDAMSFLSDDRSC